MMKLAIIPALSLAMEPKLFDGDKGIAKHQNDAGKIVNDLKPAFA